MNLVITICIILWARHIVVEARNERDTALRLLRDTERREDEFIAKLRHANITAKVKS
jgi:hypothetical protein